MKAARYRVALLVIALVCITIAIVVRLALSPVGVSIALSTQGLRLRGGDFDFGLRHTKITGLAINSARDEPVFRADTVDFTYRPTLSLRLRSPLVTVIRRSDGSWNLPLSQNASPQSTPGPGGITLPPHLRAELEVSNGELDVEQPHLLDRAARALRVKQIALIANIDSDGESSYRLRAHIGHAPVIAQGGIDAPRGLAMHRLRITELPMASLLNAIIDSDAFVVHSGNISELNLEAYGSGKRGEAVIGDHLAGQTTLTHFGASIVGLNQPLEDVHGDVMLSDDMLTFDHAQGTLAGLPFRAEGGIYAFNHPYLQISLDGNGRLEQLRGLFDFSQQLPVSGPLALHATVEGPVTSPMVRVDLAASRLQYQAMPLTLRGGMIVYDGGAVDIAPLIFQYGDIDFSAGGTIAIGDHVRPQVVVKAAAPSLALPYLDGVFGGTVDATALISGEDSALEGRVVIDGRDGSRTLRGLGHLDGKGEGIIGPLVLADGAHNVLAGAALDRPQHVLVGMLDTNGAQIHPSLAALPGLVLPRIPPVTAALDGTLAVGGDYSTYLLAGNVQARNVAYAGRYAADVVRLAFSGDTRRLSLDQAEMQGPLGALHVTGYAGTSGGAVAGELTANLGAIGKLFGRSELRGTVSAPFDAQSDGRLFAVDLANAQFTDASAFGIPFTSLNASALSDGKMLTLKADAHVAGGELLAGGDLLHGIGVSFAGLQDQAVLPHALLDGAGLVSGPTIAQAQVSGVLLARGVLLQGLSLSASSAFHADAHDLTLSNGLIQGPGLLAQLAGGVSDLGNGGHIDAHARVVDASIESMTQVLMPQSIGYYPRGSVNADVHIGGTLTAPTVIGQINVPEGSISGMHFQNAQTQLEATAKLLRLRHGSVMVGKTLLHAGGAYDGQNFRSYVNAHQANLADFNDLFDQNDMLAGTGGVRITAATGKDQIRTLADVDLRNVRVSSFDLGTTQAHWQSKGREIRGSLGVDGLSGKLAVTGGLEVAAQHPLVHVLRRSRLDLQGSVADLDLDHWLPALGVTIPVSGRLNMAGRASGNLSTLTADLTIAAHGAMVGPLPIDEAQAHLTAKQGRAIVDQAHVVVHGATADASGNFGFNATDPIVLALHANAPDIGDLATAVVQALRSERANSIGMASVGSQADHVLAMLSPLKGAASTSLTITGSMLKPHFVGALDVESAQIHALPIPRILASFALEGKKLALTDAEVALEKGDITIAGSLPLVLSPFAIGPGDAPLSLNVSADHIDVGSFTALLPPKSTLHGVLDGAIALEGTPASPQLFGQLDLAGADFVSPLESVPIRAASGSLRLGGRSANLTAGATVGGGVFALSGKASVANLTAIGLNSDYTLKATATHAAVDIANFGRGTIDANVDVSHVTDGVPKVAGTVALSDAQIPFSVFYNPAAANAPPANSLFSETQLHVTLIAGKNARVRSGSIDLGAGGQALLEGTVAHPTLAGAFTANGGTLTYFNRVFHVDSGRVAFDPVEGINPHITAKAITTVNDPDTNVAHNTSGRVTINLDVHGTLDHLDVALSSDPSYDRQQILGLLLNAPLLGAVHFNQTTGADPSANNGLNLPVANTNSGQVSVSQEAFSLVNAQFTQSLLAPISSALGGAVGLSDLAVDFDQTGGLDLSARRHIFGNVYAFFRDSLGMPTRQSLGLDFQPNDATAVSVSIFQEQALTTLGRSNTTALFPTQQSVQESASSASGGAITSGVSFSLNHRFP